MQEFIIRNGLIAQNNSIITGSFIVTNGITGSLFGTSSYAMNSLTASYALNTSQINTGSFATTGSNIFIGNQTITGSAFLINTTSASGSSASGSLLDLSQTWNTNGQPDAIKLAINNQASDSASNFMKFVIGNKNAFRFQALSAALIFGNGSNNVIIGPALATTGAGSIDGTAMRYISQPLTSTGYAHYFGVMLNRTTTSGISGLMNLTETFAPITGTGIYNTFNIVPTINQTGGANGITRGLFIDPVLTAAANYISIESSNGKVILTDTYSASGSLSGSLLDLKQTWNTTGVPSAIKLNITNISVGTGAKLLDLQVGGVNRFSVDYAGNATLNAALNANGISSSNFVSALFTSGFQLSAATWSVKANPLSSNPNAGIVYTAYNNYVGGHIFTNGITTDAQLASTNYLMQLQQTFSPTTNTGQYSALRINPTINQTGTANGITRGVLIDAILTSTLGEYRALEVQTGKLYFSNTIIAPGTTGNQTIHKIAGKVNAAFGTTSLVVTNSLVKTSSIVMCQMGTNDTTCRIISVVEANGFFTINYVAPTTETVIKFWVIN
jgi:hypothetical protein